jgi:hypothetical protein
MVTYKKVRIRRHFQPVMSHYRGNQILLSLGGVKAGHRKFVLDIIPEDEVLQVGCPEEAILHRSPVTFENGYHPVVSAKALESKEPREISLDSSSSNRPETSEVIQKAYQLFLLVLFLLYLSLAVFVVVKASLNSSRYLLTSLLSA